MAPKLNFESDLGSHHFPWISKMQPFIGYLCLPAVFDGLIEYPEFIPNAISN